MKTDAFGALDTLDAGQGPVSYYRLGALEREGLATDLDHLPFSIKVLLESVLRNVDGELVTEADVHRLAAWNALRPADVELPFRRAPDRQRYPGEPRVPRPGRDDGEERRAQRRLPRHPGGDGLAHHDDQRPGRAGLGRGRHRSGGGHARPAPVHGDAAGRRLPLD